MRMSKLQKFGIYTLLIVCAVIVFFPIAFSILLSFSNNADIANGVYIPKTINFENYINAFSAQPLLHYIKNSVIVASVSTGLIIILSLLASYSFVFMDFKGKNLIFGIFMATMMIPGEVLVISNFQTIRGLGMIDTFAGLILPTLASTFGIFLLRQNLKQIPYELKEASEISGVSNFYFFRKVVVPMAKNSIVTLGIYNFLVSWNSYMWPLLSTTNTKVRTVQIGLRQLKSTELLNDYAMIAAGAMIVSLPILLLILFGQSKLEEGLTKGALK